MMDILELIGGGGRLYVDTNVHAIEISGIGICELNMGVCEGRLYMDSNVHYIRKKG